MSSFVSPAEVIRSLDADLSTADHPIKRTFLFDGEFVTDPALIETDENTLHIQPHHDEIVMVVDGEAEFTVGDETKKVGPGDLIFIPRDTLHGPIIQTGERFGVVSVFAPYFDRDHKNFKWQRDQQ